MSITRLESARLVAVVRHSDAAAAAQIARACISGGIRVVEITWTVPEAAAILRSLAASAGEEVLFGAGTILDEVQLDEALAAGASFVVTPGVVPAVLDRCLETSVAVLPGVLTPTEALDVFRRGVRTAKLFPASTVGPAHVASLRAILPDLQLVPTGGVDELNAAEWLDAGAVAVGLGSSLNRAHRHGGFDAVQQLASEIVARVSESSR